MREADRWELEQTVDQGEERCTGAPQLQTLPVVFAQLQERFRALDRLQGRDGHVLQEETNPRSKITGLTNADDEGRVSNPMTFDVRSEVERGACEACVAAQQEGHNYPPD